MDYINVKNRGNTQVDLMNIMRWRVPPYLQNLPEFTGLLEKFDEKLARMLLPYAEGFPRRRGYSDEHRKMINPITIDHVARRWYSGEDRNEPDPSFGTSTTRVKSPDFEGASTGLSSTKGKGKEKATRFDQEDGGNFGNVSVFLSRVRCAR